MSPKEEALAAHVLEWTGRQARAMYASTFWWPAFVYYTTEDGLEGLLHELCHYIVATHAERKRINLMMDWARQTELRELEACAVEIFIADAAGFELTTPQYDMGARDWINGLNPRGREIVLQRAHDKMWRFDREHPGAIKKIIEALDA